MKLKHHDLIIDEKQPFLNCKLGREKYGIVLTSIVESYADGFVLAINNEWGAGKTTFVKMWKQYLKNKDFQTLYFNAWENDFESNPLIAILSELKTLTGDTDETSFKSLLKKGAKLSKSLLPILVKAIADKYFEGEVIKEAISKVAESTFDIFEEEVNEYASKKQGLVEFKIELEKYIQFEKQNDKPVVFIIDELDRCRPDYAVEVLEQIKHFFSVSGIVFVLSIDKKQLGNSIRGFYGSERIDADNYLKRFIDLEYKIPEPNVGAFCRYQYQYFGLSTFFGSESRRSWGIDFSNDSRMFLDVIILLFEFSKVPLRVQEKIFAHATVALKGFATHEHVMPDLFIFLIYFQDAKQDFYKELVGKKISVQELLNKFSKVIPKTELVNVNAVLIKLEAELAYRYANSIELYGGQKLIETNGTSKKVFTNLKSSIDNTNEQVNFTDALIRLSVNFNTRDLGLDYLLQKISLYDELIS